MDELARTDTDDDGTVPEKCRKDYLWRLVEGIRNSPNRQVEVGYRLVLGVIWGGRVVFCFIM